MNALQRRAIRRMVEDALSQVRSNSEPGPHSAAESRVGPMSPAPNRANSFWRSDLSFLFAGITIGVLSTIYAPINEHPVLRVVWLSLAILFLVYVLLHGVRSIALHLGWTPGWLQLPILVILAFAGILLVRYEWEHRPLEARVTFKDSPVLTPAKRRHIAQVIDGYYRYLESVGFSLQRDVPPIGTVPAGAPMMGGGGSYGPSPNGYTQYPAYASQIYIAEDVIDMPHIILMMYSSHLFNRMLIWPTAYNPQITRPEAQDDEEAEWIYQCYFPASYLDKPDVCDKASPGHKWVDALWEIRNKYGKEYTDGLLYYTILTWWNAPGKYANDFDLFFRYKLISGEAVKDNPGNRHEELDKIFAKHGINTRFPQ